MVTANYHHNNRAVPSHWPQAIIVATRGNIAVSACSRFITHITAGCPVVTATWPTVDACQWKSPRQTRGQLVFIAMATSSFPWLHRHTLPRNWDSNSPANTIDKVNVLVSTDKYFTCIWNYGLPLQNINVQHGTNVISLFDLCRTSVYTDLQLDWKRKDLWVLEQGQRVRTHMAVWCAFTPLGTSSAESPQTVAWKKQHSSVPVCACESVQMCVWSTRLCITDTQHLPA